MSGIVSSTKESDSVTSVRLNRVPLMVVALHRFTRLGMADLYAPSKRFVKFVVTPELSKKWPDLRDATSVVLIYRHLDAPLLPVPWADPCDGTCGGHCDGSCHDQPGKEKERNGNL